MVNSGIEEFATMDERQLRRKKICSDHFPAESFFLPDSRMDLKDSAVPIAIATKVPLPRQDVGNELVSSTSASSTVTVNKRSEKKKKNKARKKGPPPILEGCRLPVKWSNGKEECWRKLSN